MSSDSEDGGEADDLFADLDGFVGAAAVGQGLQEDDPAPALARGDSGEDADLGDLFDDLEAAGAPLRIQGKPPPRPPPPPHPFP